MSQSMARITPIQCHFPPGFGFRSRQPHLLGLVFSATRSSPRLCSPMSPGSTLFGETPRPNIETRDVGISIEAQYSCTIVVQLCKDEAGGLDLAVLRIVSILPPISGVVDPSHGGRYAVCKGITRSSGETRLGPPITHEKEKRHVPGGGEEIRRVM